MSSIKVKLSAVELFKDKSSDVYKEIISIAQNILPRLEKIYVLIDEQLVKIERQILRAEREYEELARKINLYASKVEDAEKEEDLYGQAIDYLYNHPKTVTTTDDEGNTITFSVVDYEAVRTAERGKEEARATGQRYRRSCEDGCFVLKEMERLINKFSGTRAGIKGALDYVEGDIHDVKKYIKAIEDESKFNMESLRGVINSLLSYLNSKSIFMPTASHYDEFASARIDAMSLKVEELGDINEVSQQSGSGGFQQSEEKKEILNNETLGLNDLTGEWDTCDDPYANNDICFYKEVCSANDSAIRQYIKQSKIAAKDLDWETKKAFEDYSDEGYKKMNKLLRGQDPEFVSKSQEELTLNNISVIADAIDNSTLPYDMNLYRGVSDPGVFLQDKNWKSKSLQELRQEFVGKVIWDKAFCSTSISYEKAERFKQTWDGTMVEIVAPEGANGILMHGLSIKFNKDEMEVLLQKGSGFKITDISYNPQIGYTITTELVGRK